MKTKIYQTPEVQTLEMLQEGILCGSDKANAGTGASWGVENGDDVDFNL
ncbi:MAG: hypothetical protein IKC68_02900 [Bacteroidales bacterium]|jgi:hypothetical protein|nr:hypothetical protein [Bacteroidales bacterium]MBR2857046.1 hypothetical protein [Bacteroidales bacterium]